MSPSSDVCTGIRPWAFAVVFCACLHASNAQADHVLVQISGVSGEVLQNVEALMSLDQEKLKDLSAEEIESLYAQAPAQVRDALIPFGLYQPVIKSTLKQSQVGNRLWKAVFEIQPGPTVKVGSVSFNLRGPGSTDPKLPHRFPMKVGDVLRHDTFDKSIDSLVYALSTNGYIDHQLERREALVDVPAGIAAIDFDANTGMQYRIGDVVFVQDLLSESLLRKYVTFKKGDIYNPETITGLQGKLLGSEYYADVDIVPRRDLLGPNNELPIEVHAKRNRANRYRLGLGYATDYGPRATLSWQRRYLNRYGHRLSTDLMVSPLKSELSAEYRIPVHRVEYDYVSFRPYYTRLDLPSMSGSKGGLVANWSELDKHGWRRNVSIEYSYEDLSQRDVEINSKSLLVPSIAWSRTKADDPLYTRYGYNLLFNLSGAVEGMVSEASFLSAKLQAKWIHALNEDYRFITRADLGSIWAKSLSDLPLSRRLFAGGDHSIRGWSLDGLSPRDKNGELAGGRYLAVGSLELERKLYDNWSVAVFTDFGNAFDRSYRNKLAYSAGFGVRWKSPLGQIRTDFAFPFSENRNHSHQGMPFRLHLVIGPDL